MRKQIAREYDQLDRDLMNGVICNEEYRKEIRLMQQYEREAAEDVAEAAYQSEMDRWG